MSARPTSRIPLTVIGGFLGSGKTTLVNRILRDISGVRATVLVNDFGAVDIDARLVAAAGGNAIALSNGCVCCSIAGDLTRTLIRVLGSQPAPEWILIEASGVSDPRRIAEVGLADPCLALEGVVVLADASSVEGQAADPRLRDTILGQLAGADWVLANKADQVAPDQLAATIEWIRAQAHGAYIHATHDAMVPLELLRVAPVDRASADRAAAPMQGRRARAPHAAPHTGVFETATFEWPEPLSAARLRALLDDMPAGIVRMKGIVRTDEAPQRMSVVQYAGRSRQLAKAAAWDGSPSTIVAVAVGGTAPLATLETRLREAALAIGQSATLRGGAPGASECDHLALPAARRGE